MNEATSELLADANDIVREQLALAWREHIERVRDVLEAQWPERMERVLEETVAGLAARLDEEHQDALEARVQQANRSAETARRELIRKLNQITRRLRGFENCIWKRHAISTTPILTPKYRSMKLRRSRPQSRLATRWLLCDRAANCRGPLTRIWVKVTVLTTPRPICFR
jgi:hypothetical protein